MNTSRTLTVNGWSASELNLSSLKKFTRYEIRVRAFNGVAAGPAAPPVSATTLEGGIHLLILIIILITNNNNNWSQKRH